MCPSNVLWLLSQANCLQAEYLCELPPDLVGQSGNSGQDNATPQAIVGQEHSGGQDETGSGQDNTSPHSTLEASSTG